MVHVIYPRTFWARGIILRVAVMIIVIILPGVLTAVSGICVIYVVDIIDISSVVLIILVVVHLE